MNKSRKEVKDHEKEYWKKPCALSYTSCRGRDYGTWKTEFHTLKPVLFEMPTYEYLRTGDVIGKCMNLSKE